jgi:hypothetical protein
MTSLMVELLEIPKAQQVVVTDVYLLSIYLMVVLFLFL